MPGHHDAGNEYTSLEDAIEATKEAMDMGLAGTNNKWVKLISFYRNREKEYEYILYIVHFIY